MKAVWEKIKSYSDIKFELYNGVAKITINRPKVYNAFRPETNIQMLEAIDICRELLKVVNKDSETFKSLEMAIESSQTLGAILQASVMADTATKVSVN